MFRLNDVKSEQMSMFSKTDSWPEYKYKRIVNGWPGFIRQHILPNINEKDYEVLYSEKASRPNTPINNMVTLLIIQRLNGFTDQETVDSLLFDERTQFAIGTLDNEKQNISKNMISNFRMKIFNHKLKTGVDLFEKTTNELNEYLVKLSGIDTSFRRIDSMMVSSSCAKMSRTELIYSVNKNFIKLVTKIGLEVEEKFQRYLDDADRVDTLYRNKETERKGKLALLLDETKELIEKYKNNKEINEETEYKQLLRIYEEQFDNENNQPRDGKDIKPTSLQTPYDEDATYRQKYGPNIGYVVTNTEAVDIEKGMSLVIESEVAPNVKSDVQTMGEIIERKIESEDKTKETYLSDAGFFSAELLEKAEKANIDLMPTDMTGKSVKRDDNLDEFVVDNNTIVECPNGEKPVKCTTSEKNTIYASFDRSKCEGCPLNGNCPVSKSKSKNTLVTSETQVELAKAKKRMEEDDYKKLAKLRSGAESIPSLLRGVYDIDNRPTKGMVSLNMHLNAAILSININKMINYLNDGKINLDFTSIISVICSFFKKWVFFWGANCKICVKFYN